MKQNISPTANGQPNGRPTLNGKLNHVRTSEAAHFKWVRERLYTPVVSDILDSLGCRGQVMHQRIRPLDPEKPQIVGRARTFRWMEMDYVIEEDPYGLEIDAMDSLRSGDVVIHSTDTSGTNAPWGELMTTVAQNNGAVGCICDGLIRDCRRIIASGFPVFHTGIRPVDSKGRGRVMAYDVPVRCGEVLVKPGELVFADFDGVVVIPREIEELVLKLAAAKVSKENASRRDLLKGKKLREVFDQYGVL